MTNYDPQQLRNPNGLTANFNITVRFPRVVEQALTAVAEDAGVGRAQWIRKTLIAALIAAGKLPA